MKDKVQKQQDKLWERESAVIEKRVCRTYNIQLNNKNIFWQNRRDILPANNAQQQEEKSNPTDNDTII